MTFALMTSCSDFANMNGLHLKLLHKSLGEFYVILFLVLVIILLTSMMDNNTSVETNNYYCAMPIVLTNANQGGETLEIDGISNVESELQISVSFHTTMDRSNLTKLLMKVV